MAGAKELRWAAYWAALKVVASVASTGQWKAERLVEWKAH